MKLPLSWLKEFLAVDAEVAELSRRLTLAGLEVENVERQTPAFSGVTVARVVKVERHPDADRLTICELDSGASEHPRVVCGAPNVKPGMVAPFAPVGARLCEAGSGPPRLGEPVGAAVIRGVRSQGMLCSERELGISEDHQGIMELDAGAGVGADLAQYLGLEETVLDIAVLANRGDCLSVLGLAREVAALFDSKLRLARSGRLPSGRLPRSRAERTQKIAALRATFPLPKVELSAPDLCPRYAALAMAGVKIGPSPHWLRRRLELCGMRALNNVVDATNYVMLEMGQPLHAFDLARIEGARIVVRTAGENREFVTLDGVRRELRPTDLMIADAARPLALAGIMGGLNSEVGAETRDILLESAYFEPAAIARTARRLELKSEASYRFERGVDRSAQALALRRVGVLIARLAGGCAAGEIIDLEPRPAVRTTIDLDLKAMAALLGVRVGPAQAGRRLLAIGARVKRSGRERLIVTPPPYRPDLREPADLAEEVARLPGLSEIPALLPVGERSAAPQDARRALFGMTRETMVGCGLTEIKTIPFVAPEDNRHFPGLRPASPVTVANPLSAETSELRTSLLAGLLAAMRFNLNREAAAFHAFELAKVFFMKDSQPQEEERLSALSYGEFALGGVARVGVKADFLSLKGIVQTYLRTIGLAERVEFSPSRPELSPYLHPGQAARIEFDGALLGYLGELHPQHARRLSLSDRCVLLELDLGNLMAYKSSPHATAPVASPPKFPAIRRDLALVVDRDFPAERAARTIAEAEQLLLESVELFDCYEGSQLPAGKKSLTLACRYRAKDRTLTDEEVNRAHGSLVNWALERLGAQLRQ